MQEEEFGHPKDLGNFLLNRNNAFHPMHYAINEEFLYIVLARGVCTQVTTLNRVNHFRHLSVNLGILCSVAITMV
jgi:hypothetical protein